MKKIVSVFVFALMIANVGFAAPAKKAYLDNSDGAVEADKGDGCGLGWQVTQKRTMIATTTRQTTNAFVPPTFGMTSGTIGCEQHQFAKNNVEATTYVVKNFENLRIEMAEGRGETLAALARTMGCNDSAVANFGEMTRAKYEVIFNSASAESPVQVLMNVDAAVKAAGICSI